MIMIFSGDGGDSACHAERILHKSAVMLTFYNFSKKLKPNKRLRRIIRIKRVEKKT